MAQLEPALAKAFGGWARGDAPKKSIGTVARSAGGKVYLIDKPGAPQSVIVAAHVAERGGPPQDLALETVMRNFGGMATSRLNRNLRLDKHWSYGTQAAMSARRAGRGRSRGRAGADRQDQGSDGRGDEGDPRRGRRAAAGRRGVREHHAQPDARLPGRFDDARRARAGGNRHRQPRLSRRLLRDYAKNVRALDEKALADAAKVFIRPDEMVWLIVGDLEKVEAGIRELKFGEVVRLDESGKSTN